MSGGDMAESESESPEVPEEAQPTPKARKKEARRKKQGGLPPEARAERKRQAKDKRRARLAPEAPPEGVDPDDGDPAGGGEIEARLARSEQALLKQSYLSKQLLVKVEA